MAEGIKPTFISLVVCDNIYRAPDGKTALVGLFNGITVGGFPANHPRLAIFASVTGLRGDSSGKIEIVHAETDESVVTGEGKFPDESEPLDVLDMNFILSNVVFPREGTYYVRFWANEHLMAMRPFDVKARERSDGSQT